VGNGTATEFPFSFQIPTGALEVRLLTISSGLETVVSAADYSVAGLDNPAGGVLTYPTTGPALSSLFKLVVIRDVSYVQESSLQNQRRFFPKEVEKSFDLLTMQTQQLQEQVARSVRVPIFTEVNPGETERPLAAALLAWDAAGEKIVNGPLAAEVAGAGAASAAAALSAASALSSKTAAGVDADRAETAAGFLLDVPNGRIVGRITAATGPAEFLTAAQIRSVAGLGTAATTSASAYATAAQGALADSALQSVGTLTQAQAEDAASTVFGTVSGQRLDEMWAARRWQYESAATAFAFSTSYTLAHGLGAQPGDVSLYLECVTTDVGFSVGERIHLDSYQNFDNSRGVSLITTTTNIIVRFAIGLYLYSGYGSGTDLTAARWRFVVRASK